MSLWSNFVIVAALTQTSHYIQIMLNLAVPTFRMLYMLQESKLVKLVDETRNRVEVGCSSNRMKWREVFVLVFLVYSSNN